MRTPLCSARYAALVLIIMPWASIASAEAQFVRPVPIPIPDAEATLVVAAEHLLFTADSLAEVHQASPKLLLGRRETGSLLLSVLVRSADTGLPAEVGHQLAGSVASRLNIRGRTVVPGADGFVDVVCPRTLLEPGKAIRNCMFGENVALILSMRYPVYQGQRALVAVTAYTDQTDAHGEQIRVAAAILMERTGDGWKVVAVKPQAMW